MINERSLKLAGVCNIPKALELGKEYQLLINNAEVRKIEELPTDGEGSNLVYHLRISEMSQVNISDGHEMIKTKAKGSPSQRFRNTLRYLMDTDTFEEDYLIFMNKLIQDADFLLNRYANTSQR